MTHRVTKKPKLTFGVLSCQITRSVCFLLCSVHMYFNRKQSVGQSAQLLTKRTGPLLLRLLSQVRIPPSFTQQVAHATLQEHFEVVE